MTRTVNTNYFASLCIIITLGEGESKERRTRGTRTVNANCFASLCIIISLGGGESKERRKR